MSPGKLLQLTYSLSWLKGDFEAHEPLLFQPCQIPGSASTAPKPKNSLRDVNRASSARASTDF